MIHYGGFQYGFFGATDIDGKHERTIMGHTYTYIHKYSSIEKGSCYNQVRIEYSEPLSDEVHRTAAALFEHNYGGSNVQVVWVQRGNGRQVVPASARTQGGFVAQTQSM